MILKLVVYDANGRDNGMVRLRMEFGSKQWAIEEDTRRAWTRVTPSAQGDLEVIGDTTVLIKDQPLGKPKSVVVKLLNVPASDSGVGCAGIGQVEAGSGGGNIFLGIRIGDFFPIRTAMLDLMKRSVPPSNLHSGQPMFKTITGYDTTRLKNEYWNPTDATHVQNKNFTCCNLFLGNMARLLGSAIGKPVGGQLLSGPLHLYKADRDRPGAWVTPSGSNFPKPGDFYSVHGLNMYNEFQLWKHVGLVATVENGVWTSLDGGQGGSLQGMDWIKWVNRGPAVHGDLNGWIDIDKYFA